MKFFTRQGRSKQPDPGKATIVAPPPAFKIEFFGISEVGHVRPNNEDVWSAVPEKQFFILADGMGGHQAGEIASSFAVESMCHSIRSLPKNSDIEQACQLIRQAIARANSKVYDASHSEPNYAGMGTTLSCFLIVDKFLIYAHIGDSRLYRFRNKIQLLTEDHSLRHTLAKREERSSTSGLLMRNVITRAIGTHASVLPDVGVIPLYSKDNYMLCSDGLSDYVEEGTIARILSSSRSLEEMGRNLVESALEKGGNDNITLLLVRIGDEKNLSG
jgi:protein phosphatase